MREVYDRKIGQLQRFFAAAGCQKAVVALSGGIDSAVVVPLAVAALGCENVRVVMLPTRYSSEGSVADSMQMVHSLGIRGDVINIDGIFQAGIDALTGVVGLESEGLAMQNMQSRIRCMATMAVSNATGALMLNTSNRSEILVGYGTLYGDTSGAVAVIGDLYKDDVYALARTINEVQGGVIPESILEKAPSAELRDDQKDSDSLPPYEVLDPVLRMLEDEGKSPEDVVAAGFSVDTVQQILGLCRANAFKRLQLPPLL